MENKENFFENLKNITNNIKAYEFKPFYFLFGDEQYFIKLIENMIVKNFTAKYKNSIKIYDADNFDYKNFANTVMSMSMFSEKKLIILKNINFTDDKIIKLLDEIKDLNIIVFENVKTIIEIEEYIKKIGVVFESNELTEQDLSKYISAYIKKQKLTIDKISLAYFIRKVGKNLSFVMNEVDKISAFVGENGEITKEKIDMISCDNVDDNVFDFINCINQNKINEAYKIFGMLLLQDAKVLNILNLLITNFQNLIVVKDMLNIGASIQNISDVLKIPSWRTRKIIDVSKNVTIEYLKNKLNKITMLCLDTMYGDIDQNIIIEILINCKGEYEYI